MYVNGNLDIAGVVSDLKLERLAADPASPALSRVWFNSGDKKIKYFDGTDVIALAAGGSLDNYLPLVGGTLTGALVLAADAVNPLEATTLQQLNAGLATKQATVTGAATTIVSANLSPLRAVVTDAAGKVAESTVTAAEIGYLAGVTSNLQSQIDAKEDGLGYVPVNKAGDSVNGNLTFGGTSTVKNLAAPVDDTDAVRLVDLETRLAGLDFQGDVVGTEDDYVDQAGRYIYVDGATFIEGAFTPNAGDIVVVNAAGEIQEIAYDISVSGENGALVWNITDGVWMNLVAGVWSAFGGLSGVTAGTGLEKSGNTISVRLGAGIANLPSGEVGIELKANAGLQLVDPSTGLDSTASNAVLGVKVGSALETTAGGLNVKASGVTEAMIAASVAGNGLVGGAGSALAVGAGTGIVVAADTVAFDTTFGDARYLTLTGGTLTGALVLAGDAVANLEAVTLQQLNGAIATAGGNTTALAARLNAGTFVYEEVTTASATHVVNHNLGNKYATVVVTDENDEVMIPQSITFNTANSLTVTFAGASLCRVIVTGVKAA